MRAFEVSIDIITLVKVLIATTSGIYQFTKAVPPTLLQVTTKYPFVEDIYIPPEDHYYD